MLLKKTDYGNSTSWVHSKLHWICISCGFYDSCFSRSQKQIGIATMDWFGESCVTCSISTVAVTWRVYYALICDELITAGFTRHEPVDGSSWSQNAAFIAILLLLKRRRKAIERNEWRVGSKFDFDWCNTLAWIMQATRCRMDGGKCQRYRLRTVTTAVPKTALRACLLQLHMAVSEVFFLGGKEDKRPMLFITREGRDPIKYFGRQFVWVRFGSLKS